MSISALLRGVERRLREVLDDQPTQSDGKLVGITLSPGRPAAGCGERFYAVHWNGGRSGDKNPQGHDTTHGVTVTITARLAKLPRDRRGRVVTAAGQLMELVDGIAGPDIIHGNYDVLKYANELIPGTREQLEADGGDPDDATTNGFLEPLVLLDFGPEAERDASWIGASKADAVFSIPVRFGEARRVREYGG